MPVMNTWLRHAALLAALPPGMASGAAPLNPVFADHAVLQRDMPIPIYGYAAPGSVVSVKLDSLARTTTADARGDWKIIYPAVAADGAPHRLEASVDGGSNTVVNDILIGDVFLCAGQSNMAFVVEQADNAKAEIATSQDDGVRSLTIKQKSSDVPLERFADPVQWQAAGPQTTGAFSASCYFFARELRRKTQIPVGMVVAAWGGSRARAWVSAEGLAAADLDRGDLDLLGIRHIRPEAADRGWDAAWEAWWHTRHSAMSAPWSPSFDDGNWKVAPASLGPWAAWEGSSPDGFVGQMWLRTRVTLSAPQAKQAATLDLGTVNEEDESWINGRGVGGTAGDPLSRHIIPAGVLRPGTNVIISNIFCSWRYCGLTGPASARGIRLADGTDVPLSQTWRYRPMEAGDTAPQLPWGPIHGAAMIHNGMIAPIGPYAFKAAIWYQGESDVHFAPLYQRTVNAMMADWRQQFRPDLPFVIVQLPNFGPRPVEPVRSEIADIREAQRLAALADPHADYVVTIDIGDPATIHPTNKQEVGRRIASTIERMAFSGNAPAGPRAVSADRDGRAVVVRFSGVVHRLVSFSGAPTAFELCSGSADDCRFVAARIDGCDEIRLDAGTTNPLRVRYCWGDSPICNLSDGSGLPAGPFKVSIRPTGIAR